MMIALRIAAGVLGLGIIIAVCTQEFRIWRRNRNSSRTLESPVTAQERNLMMAKKRADIAEEKCKEMEVRAMVAEYDLALARREEDALRVRVADLEAMRS